MIDAVTTPVFEDYWHFAAERQRIFYARTRLGESPWTADCVLQLYRFTCPFRAADRVSQYLIRRVIYASESSVQEAFFRIIFFKTFNRIKTWELIESTLGEVRWSEYTFNRYARVLSDAKQRGERLYSGAYIMPSGCEPFGYEQKHKNHLRLIERMMRECVPKRITAAASMKEAYEIFLGYPTIGPFLAYQYVVDINYSELTNFSEMEFVMAGPGARSGIRKCFAIKGRYSDEDLIRYVAEHQDEEFARRGLHFQTLWGRPLQLVDCQNLFCEVDKYARIAHPEFNAVGKRNRIKQKFRPNPEPIDYWFPPKWGINERIPPRTNKPNYSPMAST